MKKDNDILQSNSRLKQNPFTLPEGYFEGLQGRVLAAIDRQEESLAAVKPTSEAAEVAEGDIRMRPKPVRWTLRRTIWSVVASAACVACLVCGGMWYASAWQADRSVAQSNAQKSGQTYYTADEVADYAMLDNADFYAYMDEH